MSTEQPARGREAGGSGGAPVGSAVAIVIAVIAVVGGFLILRTIRSDDTTASVPETTAAPATTLAPVIESTLPPETVPTTPPQVFEGATVVVANASNVNGAAGRLSTALEGKGFTMADATNATSRLEASTIYYNAANPNALAVATTVSSLMGTITIAEAPTPVPIEGGVLPEGVDVLVLLGSDKADKTLDAMGATTSTTVAPATATTVDPAAAAASSTTAPA
jgi:hypothetical protein